MKPDRFRTRSTSNSQVAAKLENRHCNRGYRGNNEQQYPNRKHGNGSGNGRQCSQNRIQNAAPFEPAILWFDGSFDALTIGGQLAIAHPAPLRSSRIHLATVRTTLRRRRHSRRTRSRQSGHAATSDPATFAPSSLLSTHVRTALHICQPTAPASNMTNTVVSCSFTGVTWFPSNQTSSALPTSDR